MKKYKELFEKVTIGKVEIKNRYAMSAMGTLGLAEENGAYNQRGVDYYVERAKGGVGLIITGVNSVDDDIEKLHRPTIPCLTINPAAYIASAKEMTERVHSYGSKIFVQLTAGFGRAGLGHVIEEAVAPSRIENRWDPNLIHRELSTGEVEEYVQKFIKSAVIAKKSGFDGVEIHAVHEGYLLDQFTMELYNQRTDKYGGSLENRLRFPIEIVEGIKKACGEDFPVSLRYSPKAFVKEIRQGALPGEDFIEKGRDMNEGIEVAKRFEKAGYDALNVDVGTYDSWYWNHPPMYFEDGMYLPYSKVMKDCVDIPIIVAGRMDNPEVAMRGLKEGALDMVALARPLLADADIVNKIKRGDYSDVRPCLSCHEGCMGQMMHGGAISCAVNPSAGRENIYNLTPALKKKNIMVIGGGLAGMEFARVAKLRGHEPVIFEKSNRLGGNVIPGGMPKFKKDDHILIKWYEKQLKDLKIEVKYNTLVDEILVESGNWDEIIVATGSTPIKFELEGFDKGDIYTADEILLDREKVKGNVAIIGAGLVGGELALYLSEIGIKSTLVEAGPYIAGGPHGLPFMNYDMLKDLINADKNIDLKLNTKMEKLEEGKIAVLNGKDGQERVEVESVILAVGYKSENKLFEKLDEKYANVYQIGDGKKVKNIMWAIWDAYEVARSI